MTSFAEDLLALAEAGRREEAVICAGKTYLVKEMSTSDRDIFDQIYNDLEVEGDDKRKRGIRAALLISSVFTDAGDKVFNAGHLQAVLKAPAQFFDPLAAAALRVNDMSADEGKKN